jgi:hypothetical protein
MHNVLHTKKILEIHADHYLAMGTDFTADELANSDMILWDWSGAYGIIPRPVIENAKLLLRERPHADVVFYWNQVRSIHPTLAATIKGA